MPGHKGRADLAGFRSGEHYSIDVTELPGLDDLSAPRGVLADLERRASGVWGSGESIISVNGASAPLAAAMIALASRGSTVLVPRNAHRSIINGLVLSGLFPLWYEPVWDDDWGVWGPVPVLCVQRLLERCGSELAGLVLVSPTFPGAFSPVGPIARLCHEHGVPLIVDEAHGSHLLPETGMPAGALSLGADVVVHSLHKTLTGLTQTGILHVAAESRLEPDSLRAALWLLQSSSPSYPLMLSIEQAVDLVASQSGRELLGELKRRSEELGDLVASMGSFLLYQPVYDRDPAHILIGHRKGRHEALYQFLCDRGIFPEAVLGRGVLLLLGLGSTDADITYLGGALREFEELTADEPDDSCAVAWRPPPAVQILSPRQAVLLPSEVIPAHKAGGRIAAEAIAPCPPGVPVIVPGQRVPSEVVEFANLAKLRVVVE
jgi:lysine decarboxylase